MIILAPLLLSVLVGVLRGGSLLALAKVQFRCGGLILLAVALQRVIYTSWWEGIPALAGWTSTVYSVSMAMLLIAVALNHALPGMGLLGAGLFLNSIAIWSNGGHMPASLRALQTAGFLSADQHIAAWQLDNSILMSDSSRLWFLCDIFAIPRSWPLANVFSIGDLLIVLGGIIFTQTVLVPSSTAPS
jgi:hypothetical protein